MPSGPPVLFGVMRTLPASPGLEGGSRQGRSAAITWIETPLGPMVAAATDEGICLLEYTDPRRLEAQLIGLRRRMSDVAPGEHPHIEHLRAELASYFAGSLRTFTV